MIIRVGRDTAKAVAQIPRTTARLPKYATWRNANLFIIGPLIRPRLHVIVPLRWRIRLVCVAVMPRLAKRSVKIRPKHCWTGSTASWWRKIAINENILYHLNFAIFASFRTLFTFLQNFLGEKIISNNFLSKIKNINFIGIVKYPNNVY